MVTNPVRLVHHGCGVPVRVAVIAHASVACPLAALRHQIGGGEMAEQKTARSEQRGVQEVAAINGLVKTEWLVAGSFCEGPGMRSPPRQK